MNLIPEESAAPATPENDFFKRVFSHVNAIFGSTDSAFAPSQVQPVPGERFTKEEVQDFCLKWCEPAGTHGALQLYRLSERARAEANKVFAKPVPAAPPVAAKKDDDDDGDDKKTTRPFLSAAAMAHRRDDGLPHPRQPHGNVDAVAPVFKAKSGGDKAEIIPPRPAPPPRLPEDEKIKLEQMSTIELLDAAAHYKRTGNEHVFAIARAILSRRDDVNSNQYFVPSEISHPVRTDERYVSISHIVQRMEYGGQFVHVFLHKTIYGYLSISAADALNNFVHTLVARKLNVHPPMKWNPALFGNTSSVYDIFAEEADMPQGEAGLFVFARRIG